MVGKSSEANLCRADQRPVVLLTSVDLAQSQYETVRAKEVGSPSVVRSAIYVFPAD